jgi:hypothetical protein
MPTGPTDPLDLPAATQRRLGRLEELAEIGMDLARGQRDWALASEGGQGCVEVAMAFARTSRAVRLTEGMAETIEQDHAAEAVQAAASHNPAQNAAMSGENFQPPFGGARPDFKARVMKVIGKRLRVAVRKDEVRYVVERSIAAAPRADGERLDIEHWGRVVDERLESDSDDAWLTRPLGEIAATICRDLGVAFESDLWMTTADPAVAVRGDDYDDADEDDPPDDGPALWPPSDDGVRRGFADFRPSTALGVYERFAYERQRRGMADTS